MMHRRKPTPLFFYDENNTAPDFLLLAGTSGEVYAGRQYSDWWRRLNPL